MIKRLLQLEFPLTEAGGYLAQSRRAAETFSSHRVHREHRAAETVLTTIPNTNCTKRTSGQATLSHKDNKILPGTFMCRGNKNISESSVNSVAKILVAQSHRAAETFSSHRVHREHRGLLPTTPNSYQGNNNLLACTFMCCGNKNISESSVNSVAKNVVAKIPVAQKLCLRTPASPAVNLPTPFVSLSLSGKNLSAAHRRHAGFSMIEILFAIAILALGLLMIAAVFPVAIKWTQQDANKTIGQIIANNAIGIIETKYNASNLTGISTNLAPLPGIVTTGTTAGTLTLNDRTYEFGSYSPYPAPALAPTNTSHYYWTALARLSPDQPAGGTSVDLYILVYYKGDYTYQYPYVPSTSSPEPLPGGSYPGAVGSSEDGSGSGYGNAIPFVQAGSLTDPAFPIGAIGIDYSSGGVFRKIVNVSGAIVRSDGGPAGDTVLYCPPADNATASPLIYVYTTTVTF
ncbi:MAG: type IV pilus modification PilV family protein [Phycisphaerae bacterium]